eukprot:3019312-Rhodomonas_salina.3
MRVPVLQDPVVHMPSPDALQAAFFAKAVPAVDLRSELDLTVGEQVCEVPSPQLAIVHGVVIIAGAQLEVVAVVGCHIQDALCIPLTASPGH